MEWTPEQGSLDFHTLSTLYRSKALKPSQVIEAVYDRIAKRGDDSVWIHLVNREEALSRARQIEAEYDPALPLWGLPCAIKDNIDVVGLPTTNAFPPSKRVATSTGRAVTRLLEAGAIVIGKTNLDQWGLGLVGMRSPFGACSSVFHPDYISGGSSSGSAVAVAAGLVSFALGNDAAGSGRVPASFNNIVGLKPTPGVISNTAVFEKGVARSLETISVFALTCEDAVTILRLIAGFDPEDTFSKPEADQIDWSGWTKVKPFRFGVPQPQDLEFFGDEDAEALFNQAIDRLKQLGGTPQEIDFTPFAQTQKLLYESALLAERAMNLQPHIQGLEDKLHPVTRQILSTVQSYRAEDAFAAQYQVAEFKRMAWREWDKMDVLIVPTAPTIYRKEEVAADPIRLNANLGTYTNFVNLMGLCGVAVPNGFRKDGLPLGITILGQSFQEPLVTGIGAAFHRKAALPLGATAHAYPDYSQEQIEVKEGVSIAVVGAHLSGEPLNYQLTDLGGELIRACRTAPCYRLYALTGSAVPKPSMVRDAEGVAIEVEVWQLPVAGFGRFVDLVPPPLAIGNVELEDGIWVKGFLGEPFAIAGVPEISEFGGWRNYLKSLI